MDFQHIARQQRLDTHDTMSKYDPATYTFKRFVGKTEEFHTKLQEDCSFKLKNDSDGTMSDVEHFAPTVGELEVMIGNLVEQKINQATDEAEDDNIPAPSRKECVLRIKTQMDTALGNGYTAEDILFDELEMEECCAYCWYGFEGDVPNYINDIYRRLELSSKTCDKVSRHEDFVVGVIVRAVSEHILNYFLRRLEEESEKETPFE